MILIIGSQGYLGSRLTDYLQEHGYNCVGADIGYFKDGVLFNPKPVNMLDREARDITEKDLEKFETVILLAGISNDPFGNLKPDLIYNPTRDYAIKIARMCKKLGVRFIFPSSCSVYGIGNEIFNEESPTNPQTAYSLNKLQIEEKISELADHSFSPIALRLSTIFGLSPRIRFDVVINMLCGMALTRNEVVLNSDGKAWRPHLDIEDACKAFLCCINWDYRGGKLLILNIGRNDNNLRIIDVARLIQSKVNKCELRFLGDNLEEHGEEFIEDQKIQDGADKRTYKVLFDRAQEVIPDFKIQWNVESGIDRLISDLERCNLNETKFMQRDFYRLHQIEYLYKTKKINSHLQWS